MNRWKRLCQWYVSYFSIVVRVRKAGWANINVKYHQCYAMENGIMNKWKWNTFLQFLQLTACFHGNDVSPVHHQFTYLRVLASLEEVCLRKRLRQWEREKWKLFRPNNSSPNYGLAKLSLARWIVRLILASKNSLCSMNLNVRNCGYTLKSYL